MKKNKTTAIITAALVVVALLLIFNNRSGSIREELKDFAIKDTASITKFFIADRAGHSVTLERQAKNRWTVNKKYNARQEGINILLDACKKMAIRTRVAKAAYNNIIKELAASGIKCEIYQDNKEKPSKVYYVGGSTQDVLGTFMMLENSTVPFVTEIPGFEGYLTPRFSSVERDWRETIVFSYAPEEIKSVSVMYRDFPEKSFVLEKNGTSYTVTSPATHQVITQPDTIRVKNYLAGFSNLRFEGWDYNSTDQQRDSLYHAVPSSVLTVMDVNGKKTSMNIYPKPITKTSLAQNDSLGNPLKYDIDRMYTFINNNNELLTIQQYVFGKAIVSFSDFDKANNRKNSSNARR